MRLRFLGFSHSPGYDGPSGSWSAGDVREVEEVEARRLLADFASAFEPVPTPAAPVAHTAMKEPPARRTFGRR